MKHFIQLAKHLTGWQNNQSLAANIQDTSDFPVLGHLEQIQSQVKSNQGCNQN